MSKPANINFIGDTEIIKKLDKLGVDVVNVIRDVAVRSLQVPKQEMLNYVKQHKQTGETESSWGEEIEQKTDYVKVAMGFNIGDKNKQGLPAIFLNIGTPYMEPSYFIDHAIDHNRDKIYSEQQKALIEVATEVGLC